MSKFLFLAATLFSAICFAGGSDDLVHTLDDDGAGNGGSANSVVLFFGGNQIAASILAAGTGDSTGSVAIDGGADGSGIKVLTPGGDSGGTSGMVQVYTPGGDSGGTSGMVQVYTAGGDSGGTSGINMKTYIPGDSNGGMGFTQAGLPAGLIVKGGSDDYTLGGKIIFEGGSDDILAMNAMTGDMQAATNLVIKAQSNSSKIIFKGGNQDGAIWVRDVKYVGQDQENTFLMINKDDSTTLSVKTEALGSCPVAESALSDSSTQQDWVHISPK